MRSAIKGVWIFFAAGMMFLFCGCTKAATEGAPSAGAAEDGVSIKALFRQEDGRALRGGSVRFSFGEDSVDCPLSDSGELTASGLPRIGCVTLVVLDSRQEVRGSMVLSLTKGAVIDAATDEGGSGHITLREDTESVALAFTVGDDGAIRCSLRLTEQSPRHVDLLQEDDQSER